MSDTLKLKGKRAIITGANRGLGEAIARAFLAEGAAVLLCAREEVPLRRVADSLQALAPSAGRVLSMAADVSRPEDVDRLVCMVEKEWQGADVLINHAGIYGPLGKLHECDWNEWVKAVEVNLLGSAYMARAVLPLFMRQRDGRIIQLSGGGATSPLPRISAYAASKAGIVRFTETLAAEYLEYNIYVNAMAPGALNTRLLDEVLEAGPDRVGEAFYRKALQQKDTGGASLCKATQLAVFLASEAASGITGKLFSAVWDPWQSVDTFREELMGSDVYTLRRIVPQDRGLNWEPPCA